MEFLSEYGMFLAKIATVVFGVFIVVAILAAAAAKTRKEMKEGSIRVRHLNKQLDEYKDVLREAIEDEDTLKQTRKEESRRKKQEAKTRKKQQKQKEIPLPGAGGDDKARIYVIDFHGDPRATQVTALRHCITAVLSVIRPERDQVLLRLESPGGMVHAYGLAASQLDRIRQRNIPLLICVDKVAASGGYMMACLGTKIYAAPFAYIGSIGVVLQLPNFNRLLKSKNVDFEMITAGEYKRTLTIFGENTDKGRAKVSEEIQEIHDLFKDFVKEHRPQLDIESVATGEIWFGRKALEKSLIDEIRTSDECITEACQQAEVYEVSWVEKKKLADKLGRAAETALDNTLHKWLQKTPPDHTM